MIKKVSFCLLLIWAIALVATSFYTNPEDAEAIPAFARKYRMSCTTCHSPFPKLKAYGDDFAGNGFVLTDQEAPRYFVDTGDEELDLIREFPLGARLEGFLKYQSESEQEVDFSTPYNLKLLSGGAVTDDIAYYFYFYMSERGEVAGIEDAYIMFNNMFDSELDLYFGQFQVSDPLFKRELRLTYEDYEVYKHKVGESDVSLAYDKGIMLTYGFETGTDIIAEVINGNGIGEADESKIFDDDKYKNFAGRISQDIGEYVRVGGFGYYGKEEEQDNLGVMQTNDVMYFGPDLTLAGGPLELNFQYMMRQDSDPSFVGYDGDEYKTNGIMAELIYLPDGDKSKWYLTGLFNNIDSDFGDYKYNSITGHAGYVMKRNLRHFAEITYETESEESRFVTGFVLAF